MSLADIQQKIAKYAPKDLTFKTSNYIFVRVLKKFKNSTIYEVEEKDIPIFIVPDELFEQYYTHSPVVKLTKLCADEEKIKHRFTISQLRKGLDAKACPYLLKYQEEGLIQWGDNLYHCVKYDDPCSNLHDWIMDDHKDLQIKTLEVYRILLSGLKCFDYLESNGYILTQYNTHNVYAGAIFEDRFNFIRLNFKGHKKDQNLPLPDFNIKHEFSSPEDSPADLYKSYEFTLGLIALWSILITFKKEASWKADFYDSKNEAALKAAVTLACEELYEGESDEKLKKQLEDVFSALFVYKVGSRKSAKQILEFEYFSANKLLDEEEYQREIEENERERKRMEEEEKKNFEA